MQPPSLQSRDPRQGLVAKGGPGQGLGRPSSGFSGSSSLTGAISKTLGVLTRQLGELEAVEAEEEVLGFGGDDQGLGSGDGQRLGVRDYYFDDEEVFDEDELLQGCG